MTTPAPANPGTVTLCRLDDIPDPGARGFELIGTHGAMDVVVVRSGRTVHGYVNSCPHQGTPLETFPDRFLSQDGAELICSTHGARFRIEDGLCTRGPCKGKRLRPAAVARVGEQVCLTLAPGGA